jgi:TonB-dependent receptor
MKEPITNTIKTTLLASAAGMVMSLAVAPVAFAQSNDSTAGENEEIVVTGIRATTENALNAKRKADVILDGISADDLGNFPDLNLGEALQRITGVQIDRSGDRRDATISVRGLPGAFTQTTIMGQNIASPRGFVSPNRSGNPFGVFDSQIFNGADVEKSFTAESLSGGLAANVNLKLKSALDRRDGAGVVRGKVEYEESTEKFNPGIYGTYAKHFNDGKFGVYGTAAYSKQNFRRDSLNITEYRNDAQNLSTEFDGGATRSDLYVGDFRRFTNEIIGDRLSAAAGMEFQVNENFNFRVDGIYAERDLKDATQDIVQVQPRQSRPQVTSPDDGELIGRFDFDGNGTDEDVYLHQVITSNDPQIAIGNRRFPSREETWAIYPQASWESENLRLNVVGTISEASNFTILDQFDARINQTGSATENRADRRDRTNGVVANINTGGANFEDFAISLDIPDTALDLSGGGWAYQSTNGIQVRRNNNGVVNVFTIAGFAQGVDREMKAIEADLEYDFSKGPFTGVKIGGRFENENADTFRFNNSLFGTNVDALDNSVFAPGTAALRGPDFFGGRVDGSGGDEFISLDLDRVRELLLPLQTSGNGENVPSDIVVPTALRGTRLVNPRPIPLIANPFTDFNQATNNWRNGDFSPVASGAANPVNRTFTAERDNLELFGMMKFDFEENYSAFPVRGNFGLRYIETDLSGLTEFGPDEEGVGSYKEWLPSANIIANLRDDVVMNFAYYKTFEAFNLAEFQPLPSTVTVNEPDPAEDDDEELRSGRISIVGSGLRLDPRSSEAFDLGIAWYNRPGSIIGLNYFTKEVIGNIQRLGTGGVNNEFCTLPLDELAADNPDVAAAIGNGTPFNDSQGRCRLDIGLDDRENPSLNVTRFINQDPIRVNGLEFQATQNTDFLDGFWGNFGGTFNYTYVDTGTDEARLPGVSKQSYNLIGFYETDKFSVRLAQNYRSRADLESGGTFFGGARQTKARTQYDLALTYNPRKSTQFRLQGFNLTNVIREEFQLLEALPRRRDFDGRTITLSVQQRF